MNEGHGVKSFLRIVKSEMSDDTAYDTAIVPPKGQGVLAPRFLGAANENVSPQDVLVSFPIFSYPRKYLPFLGQRKKARLG